MKRKHLNFTFWEKRALKDPAFRSEYDRLQSKSSAFVKQKREMFLKKLI